MAKNKPSIPLYIKIFITSGIILLLIAGLFLYFAIVCNWDDRTAQWVSAVGTWVGGIFTGGALLFAGLQLSRTDRKFADEIERNNRNLKSIAHSCTFRVKEGKYQEGAAGSKLFTSVNVQFQNKTGEVVRNLSVMYRGKELATAIQVNPGANPWGHNIPIDIFNDLIGEKVTDVPQDKMGKILPLIRENLVYHYEIGGVVFERQGNSTEIHSAA